jgi:transcriptional regulator with XRE-family HTH domain
LTDFVFSEISSKQFIRLLSARSPANHVDFTLMAKRTSTAIDVHIGHRIRLRRKELKLSQAALGEAIGVTCEQIQGYEKGTDRVGAQRLQAIAAALQAPISFFFEEIPGSKRLPKSSTPNFVDELLADQRGLELARLFVAITDTAARDAVLVLAEMFARRAKERPDLG